jgi:hypothetical protein
MGEVIQFPDRKRQVANDNHMPDIDIIVDQSKDLQERSEALLRWAEEMLKDYEDKD